MTSSLRSCQDLSSPRLHCDTKAPGERREFGSRRAVTASLRSSRLRELPA
jgi:hypothetical protein